MSFLLSKCFLKSLFQIFAFTGLVRLSGVVAEMSGVTHRVGELVECLRAMPREQRPFGQLGDSSSDTEKRSSSLVRKEPHDPEVAFCLRQVLKNRFFLKKNRNYTFFVHCYQYNIH